MKLVTRHLCRICESQSLTPVVDLGDQYISSNFAISADFPPVQRRIPLQLVRCNPELDQDACGLVQLKHSVPGDLMYNAYGYRSGINQTMRDHLAGIVRAAQSMVDLNTDDIVVDIGANDGTLLESYATFKGLKVGYEPSNIAPASPGPNTRIIRDYFSAEPFLTAFDQKHAKIVTSIAMFYDLEDPNAFTSDVAKILDPNGGVWIVEMSYLPLMLEKNSFDTICHEHLEYYSLSVLTQLMARHGLRIFDAELNGINGGSIRCYVCHENAYAHLLTPERKRRMYAMNKAEFELELEGEKPYSKFRVGIEGVKLELRKLLTKLQREGKVVYGYGASTKGNVILQYCELDHSLIKGIADRNPAKWGTFTHGTEIPIVSEEEMRKAKPDYLLVLPWHFMAEFADRESSLVHSGTQFIIPLPTVRVTRGA